MRTSIAAFALFRRAALDGSVQYLAQWNEGWNAFHLVGGHKHDNENFRECCVREVAEELQLIDGREIRIAAEPRARLQYVQLSQRACEETEYTFELFDAELLEAGRFIEANPKNRWVGEREIATGRCGDGRPVSPTFLRILSLAGLMSSGLDTEHVSTAGKS